MIAMYMAAVPMAVSWRKARLSKVKPPPKVAEKKAKIKAAVKKPVLFFFIPFRVKIKEGIVNAARKIIGSNIYGAESLRIGWFRKAIAVIIRPRLPRTERIHWIAKLTIPKTLMIFFLREALLEQQIVKYSSMVLGVLISTAGTTAFAVANLDPQRVQKSALSAHAQPHLVQNI